ncbi:hypothetical protein [Burkholderia sp. Bp9012]|uniref:hypothetical protein n=1 Tax=Burkholderia sp. Bp9012 TaxID=2184562 RepID=UPI000F59F550|nr:hypothetical protein [Burkholderia sp. Bp9012]
MTILPIAVHGGVRRIRFRLLTAWHQSRKCRGSTVDLSHGEARHANDRHGALLDVSQAGGAFRQHNRSVTPKRLEAISC